MKNLKEFSEKKNLASKQNRNSVDRIEACSWSRPCLFKLNRFIEWDPGHTGGNLFRKFWKEFSSVRRVETFWKNNNLSEF